MSTWWIDEPFILGGSNPTNLELERLRTNGFNVLVSLLEEDEQLYSSDKAKALGYTRYSIPILDFGAPSLRQLAEFAKIMESVPPNSKVLIHCEAGIGRTGTMAAAYWIAKGMTPDGAIQWVRKAAPFAIQTAGQEAVLRRFANQLSGAKNRRPGKRGYEPVALEHFDNRYIGVPR